MSRAWSLAAVAIALAAWELAARTGAADPVLVSMPSQIVGAATKLVWQPTIWLDVGYSLQAFGLAMTLALALGTAFGCVVGFSRTAYQLVAPALVAINALPKVVLMPLVILWVGIGMAASVTLGAVMAAFPIVMAVHAGVRALERDHIRLARAFGASRGLFLRTIVLPGVLPYLAAGTRVAINYAMVGVLLSEFFGSSRGVGHRMMALMANFQVAAFFVYLVLAAGIVLGIASALQRVETSLLRWRPAVEPLGGP